MIVICVVDDHLLVDFCPVSDKKLFFLRCRKGGMLLTSLSLLIGSPSFWFGIVGEGRVTEVFTSPGVCGCFGDDPCLLSNGSLRYEWASVRSETDDSTTTS